MSPIERRRLRVPRGDRQALLRPEPAALAALVRRNSRLLASFSFDLAGRPFHEFRAAARAEVLALACRYAARWNFSVPDWREPMPIILSGHQPRPFHPGVWIKNFLAGELVSAVGGIALNLNVDNDEAHVQVFRLPTRRAADQGGGEEVCTVEVEFAPHARGVPFEEQPAGAIRPETVHEVLALAASPAIGDAFRACWDRLLEAVPDAACLGEAFVVARRRLEERLGLANLELPVSALSDTSAFRLFVAAMLRRREDFFAAYNDSLHEFRRVYRERSPAQPVPDLAREGARMELPYWVWRAGGAGDMRRRRLWVEPTSGGGLTLAAEDEPIGRLSAEDLDDASRGAERLAELRRSGWKIRPRAISMTLFVRLAVGDVFIHGVGGALYDQITDAIIERLFGVRPPEIILASATVHLPLGTFPATPADLSAARRAVRDWRYNPDRLLPEGVRRGGEAKALIEEKRRLIATSGATRDERRRIWQRIREINGRLLTLAPEQPDAAQRELDRIRREVRYNTVLTNREYPFCLYPAEDLAAFYRGASRASAR
ncbi:MAG TPA: hypothetical protein VFH53_09975 [Phycisphaerae bacterium]|nr:hypothetical protein [Phycisphaerae bacterium]